MTKLKIYIRPDFQGPDKCEEGMLKDYGGGMMTPLVTLPVYDRPADRTVWEVRRGN